MRRNSSLTKLRRLLAKRQFDEKIVLVFCVVTVVLLTPFALGRVLTGDWLRALLDALAVVVTAGVGLHTWRSGPRAWAGPVLVALFAATVVTAVYLFGPELLLWLYPVTIAIFFLLRPGLAVPINLLLLVATAPRAADFGSLELVVSLIATLVATNALALVFASSMRRSRSRLSTLAEHDPLTGARNRYALEPALRNALERCSEQGTPASLLVVDVDRFKRINDQLGHAAGDRALKRIASLIIAGTRAGDDVFRYGGEELVVLAHGAGAEAAARLADKLRREVAATVLEGVGSLSVSVGVAEAQLNDRPDTWFHRADAMMYRAKREGRNRVAVDEGPQLSLAIPEFE